MEITPILVPLIIGLTYAVWKAGVPKRYSPIIGVLFGVGLTFVLNWGINAEYFLSGIATGLSSLGLYSGIKKTVKG